MLEKNARKGFPKIAVRLLFLAAALFLALSTFFPWWNLALVAPQYPEGLNLTVYPSHLAGEIDIINTLNHYIGMADITQEGFPELKVIPLAVWGFVLLLVLNALFLSRQFSYGILLLLLAGAVWGIYDMYHWLHTFGTQLSPEAPIKVPPFVPPVIGKNTLANFITYSSFQTGFYFVALGFVVFIIGLWGEIGWGKKVS